MSLSADGIDSIVVDCGAGSLSIAGVESMRNIEVEAEIIVGGKRERDLEKYVADNVRLELKKQGNRAILTSRFKNSFPKIGLRERKINLTVVVPKNMDVDVDDGSGDMKIENIEGNLQIGDGSGVVIIRGIVGDVDIEDGSGTIDIRDVSGSVNIDDGSGTIEVNGIGRNVQVNDGSGSIYIDGVEGDVIIKDDGSGSIRIQNVKGKVVK